MPNDNGRSLDRIWLIHDAEADEPITWSDKPNPYAEFDEEPDAAIEYVRADLTRTSEPAPSDVERLEFRPDDDGEFDEIVARYADGMVHVETMSRQGCYVGFYWDDGRYCQWWIGCTGKGKLTYNHEDGNGPPPKFSSGYASLQPNVSGDAALVERAFREGYEAGWCTGTAAMQEDRAWNADAEWQASEALAAITAMSKP